MGFGGFLLYVSSSDSIEMCIELWGVDKRLLLVLWIGCNDMVNGRFVFGRI